MNRLKKTTNIFYKCLLEFNLATINGLGGILLLQMFSKHCCSGRKTAAPAIVLLLSTILLQGSRQVLLATPLLLLVSTMLLMFSTLLILVCLPVMHTAVPG
jgi:hypothetical protein